MNTIGDLIVEKISNRIESYSLKISQNQNKKVWVAKITLTDNKKLNYNFEERMFTRIENEINTYGYEIYENRIYCIDNGNLRGFYILKNSELKELKEATVKSKLKK